MAMNHYAIQIFHARLKVRFLKYDVNPGSQQWIIIQKSAFLLFECVTRDSTSKQKQEKFFTVSRLIKAFKITFHNFFIATKETLCHCLTISLKRGQAFF